MSMTRRDFALVAECIRQEFDDPRAERRDRIRTERLAIRMGRALEKAYPNFDIDRFMTTAAGVSLS